MRWQPWRDYQDSPVEAPLDIPGPPCGAGEYWFPRMRAVKDSEIKHFVGCGKGEWGMFDDFSCYSYHQGTDGWYVCPECGWEGDDPERVTPKCGTPYTCCPKCEAGL